MSQCVDLDNCSGTLGILQKESSVDNLGVSSVLMFLQDVPLLTVFNVTLKTPYMKFLCAMDSWESLGVDGT